MKAHYILKVGDLVSRTDVLDFKGFLLQELQLVRDSTQLELEYAKKHKLSYWKVLWFKHPYSDAGPVIETLFADVLERHRHNGLQNRQI